jgi:hypothetical protein
VARDHGVTLGNRASRGWSRAATAAFLSSSTAVVVLHVVRADLDPIGRRLSEYAVGPFGWLMTAAFMLLGVGLYALSRAVRSVDPGTPAMKVLRVLLVIAAAGMTVSAVFETQAATPPGWREIVHSRASALAFIALIAAALWTATVARRAMAWGAARGAADAFTTLATLSAVISPVTHDGPWTGLVQRLSYLAVLCWLLLASSAAARTPTATERSQRRRR